MFGATFNENYDVEHCFVEKKEDLEKLRGSKYVRSEIGKTYSKAKEFLDDGKLVLFSGTPCQIAGIRNYLKKDYENLFLQDIICHGTPMKSVWNKYKQYMNINDNTESVSFRNKDSGWKKFSIKIKNDNNVYLKEFSKDSYMKIFLSNLSLNESCYNCKFKGENRNSDITLADFWGIDKVLPEIDDDKGTSLIIVNSDKGARLLNDASKELKLEEIDFSEAIKYNVSYSESPKCPIKRKDFLEQLENVDFNTLANKFVRKPNLIRVILGKFYRKFRYFLKVK